VLLDDATINEVIRVYISLSKTKFLGLQDIGNALIQADVNVNMVVELRNSIKKSLDLSAIAV